MRTNQRLELLCGEEGRSGVVSSRELLCPSDTPGGSDMIDVSVPWVGGGGVAPHILSLSVRMRSVPSAPHKTAWLKSCNR